ncbi:DsbC family protein [Castellaniella sp.]|uniref:DsbC family protein n=1 Tax=Castellaniella sp. TaxID=1955812 RepID=UPI00355DF3FC
MNAVFLAALMLSAATLTAQAQPSLSGGSNDAHQVAQSAQVARIAPERLAGIQKAFEQRFPGIQAEAVRPTPFDGLYEVQVGLDLVYTDEQAQFVLQGSLIDARARRDLTAERLEVLQQVAFDSLPLKDAIKQVKGSGAREVAVFEDPNCGYCKQLHKTLEGIDDITVYTFLYPILSPDSRTRSRNIWCAEDPARVWREWMVHGKQPVVAECDTPLQSNLALGRKLNVQGTPALFFADGSRINGAMPLEVLQQKFDAQGPGQGS